MKLSHKQKNYIKKNIKQLTPQDIAASLQIPVEDVVYYLKKKWGEEKYRKYLKRNEVLYDEKTTLKSIDKNIGNFKGWRKFIKKNYHSFLFLLILIVIAYFNSINNAFVSDDIDSIVRNKNLGNINYVFSLPIHIVGNFFHYLAYKIGGLTPFWFRLVNYIFHTGSVFVLYTLTTILFGQMIALLTASIFAVHPILSESVVWIAGVQYPQAAFFCLSSLLAYAFATKQKKYYFISLLMFILAVLASEKAIVFPLIIFVFELSFGNIRKNWRYVVGFFVVAGFMGHSYFSMTQSRTEALKRDYYLKASYFNPFLQIPTAITSYLQLIFWPDKLTLYHSELSFSPFEYSLRLIITILFFGSLFFFYKKNRSLFFWLIFFVISLLPTLTPLPIAWIVAERYVYLGSAGIFFIIAYFLVKLIQNRKLESLGYILVVLILFLLTTRTIIRNIDWKNEDNLWLALSKTSPSDPKTHNNLGDMYSRHNDLSKAEEEFKKAIKLLPDYADAYHNLANTYFKMGKVDEALKNYQKAIKYNPRLWQSHQNSASIYFNMGRYDLALEHIKKAISLTPDNSSLYTNLGVIYAKKGEKNKAKEAFSEALRLDPTNTQAKSGFTALEK